MALSSNESKVSSRALHVVSDTMSSNQVCRSIESKEKSILDHNSTCLSEYEKLRAKNIERNNNRMVALGLMSAEEAKLANQNAWKKNNEFNQSTSDEKNNEKKSNCRRISNTQSINLSSKRTKSSSEKGMHQSNTKRTTRSAAIKRTSKDEISSMKGSRKSLRKRGKKPYEAEGIWI